MSYEGRTPIRDVIRSVVLGAAMVSPAALEACTKEPQPKPPEPDPLPSTTATGTATATATQPDEPVVSGASQRPRGKSDGGPMIPTRGFSGRGR